ncbi:MAG: VOC family protein [Desulfobulbaceae bacterium]|nr:VOC family protein [Desulfobulbaceae bacterium]
MKKSLMTANAILYCKEWDATVRFYRDRLGLPVLFATDWFVEFGLSAAARLSIADEKHASIKSCGGEGITLALQVEDIDSVRTSAEGLGLKPTAIKRHPWDARVFYLFDPEGHRLEIWESLRSDEAPELSLQGP